MGRQDSLNNRTKWTTLVKLTTNTIANNATLADDSELMFPVAANGIYMTRVFVTFFFFAECDMKFAVSAPASPANTRRWRGHYQAATSSSAFIDSVGPPSSTVITSTTNANGWLSLNGLIENGSNSGNIALQFAQNTSHANQLFILPGSYLEYIQIA